jgi:hypothetical protein
MPSREPETIEPFWSEGYDGRGGLAAGTALIFEDKDYLEKPRPLDGLLIGGLACSLEMSCD